MQWMRAQVLESNDLGSNPSSTIYKLYILGEVIKAFCAFQLPDLLDESNSTCLAGL